MPRMTAGAILAALPHVLNRQAEEELYRKYVTDSMFYMKREESLKYRYAEIISGEPQKEDTRTGDEIAADIINKVGLKI